MKTILEEAAAITSGARLEAYGDPRENWERTAAIWSAILGVTVTAEQALMCMIGVKLAREAHRPLRDTRIDIAGYAEILDRISLSPSPGEVPSCSLGSPATPTKNSASTSETQKHSHHKGKSAGSVQIPIR